MGAITRACQFDKTFWMFRLSSELKCPPLSCEGVKELLLLYLLLLLSLLLLLLLLFLLF
jgi:hypothetical protein